MDPLQEVGGEGGAANLKRATGLWQERREWGRESGHLLEQEWRFPGKEEFGIRSGA